MKIPKNIYQNLTKEKFMKVSFVIYPGTELLLGKIDTCHANLKKSTTKVNKHTTCGFY